MPTLRDVFYGLGRNYFPRANMHAVYVGVNQQEAVTGMAEAMLKNQEVYGIPKTAKLCLYGNNEGHLSATFKEVVEFRGPKDDVSVDFSGKMVILLYVDFPKDINLLTKVFLEWRNIVVPGGVLVFRDAYEDDELSDHPMAQLGKTCLHGIYRSDPNITVFLNKWGIADDK